MFVMMSCSLQTFPLSLPGYGDHPRATWYSTHHYSDVGLLEPALRVGRQGLQPASARSATGQRVS